MKHSLPWIAAFCLFVMIAPSPAYPLTAPETILLNETVNEYEATSHMVFYEDRSGKLTFNDITSSDIEWKKSPGPTHNFGFSKSSYWFAFTAKNSSPGEQWVFSIRYPLFDDVTFFPRKGATDNEIIHTGDMRPFANRLINDRTFTFPLTFDKNDESTFYIRITSESSFNCIFSIMTYDRFNDVRANEKFIYGIYFGILIVISLYNFLIFLKVRDTNYVFYILFVISHGLFQMEFHGLSMEYLWPESPAWNNSALNFFGGQSIIWTVLFAKYFLETHRTTPRLDKVLLLFILPGLVQMAASFLLPYSLPAQIGTITLMLLPPVLWFTGFLALLSGFRQARFYLTAWSIYLIFVIIWALSRFALFPTGIMSEYGMQIGSAIEAVLLSLALGDRMNILGEEKIEAQRKFIKEQEDRIELQREYTDSISRFVPREFLAFLHKESILNVKLGDQTLEKMSVLFTDIRSFTSISEKLTPEQTIAFLNTYLAKVGPIIREHHGFIDKYIGDAIMALFPGSPDNALKAAINMKKEVARLSSENILPLSMEFKTGIGIHYGTLVLGTVGESHRIDTTVIADAVNVASRLESLTKRLETDIIISQDTYDALANPADFSFRKLGRVKVKGREHPLTIIALNGTSL